MGKILIIFFFILMVISFLLLLVTMVKLLCLACYYAYLENKRIMKGEGSITEEEKCFLHDFIYDQDKILKW